MTNAEINKLLHERVVGQCWQEYLHGICIKCGRWSNHGGMISANWNPSYTSSWADYGRLLEAAMTKERWREFAYTYESEVDSSFGMFVLREDLLNPLRGSTAMAEFIKEIGI